MERSSTFNRTVYPNWNHVTTHPEFGHHWNIYFISFFIFHYYINNNGPKVHWMSEIHFNFLNHILWLLLLLLLYPATKVWRGIMLYPSVSVRLSVRPSVRPSVRAHHFRSITWVFIHGIFSNFAYIFLSAMSGMELLMGKIRPFLTELLPFFVLEKWFLACYSFTVHDIWMKLHRYVAHQRLHIVTKDRHSDLPSLWVIRPW